MAQDVLGTAHIRIKPVLIGFDNLGSAFVTALRPAETAIVRLNVRIEAIGTAARTAAGQVGEVGEAARRAAGDAGGLAGDLQDAGRAGRGAADDVDDVGDAARRAGGDVDDLRDDLDDAGDAGEGAAGRTESAWSRSMSSIGGFIKTGFAGIATAAGGALSYGIASSLSAGLDNAQLAAQLGLDPAEAEKAARISGSVYAGGWGDSIGGINVAIRGLWDTVGAGSEQALTDLASKASAIASIFEQDTAAVTSAISQMLSTGLAGSAQEAADLLTAGFQAGADRGGDFLDTIIGSVDNLRTFGFTGQQATGLIVQGLGAGAESADSVIGLFEELVGNVSAGGDDLAATFQALGLDAAQMTTDLTAGGPAANAALDALLDSIRALKDPIQQDAIVAGLFGEEGAAMQNTLLAIDPSSAVQALGSFEGATQSAMDTVSASPAAALDQFKRTFLARLTEVGGIVVQWGQQHSQFVKPLAIGIGALAAVIVVLRIGMAAVTAAQTAWTIATKVWSAATRVATAIQTAFNVVMAMNPIGLVIIAVVALVGVFILLWIKVEGFRNFWIMVWGGIKTAAVAVWDWLKQLPGWIGSAFATVGQAIAAPFVAGWNLITAGANMVIGWVRANWPLLLGIITGPIGLAVVLIIRYWSDIQAAGQAVWNWIASLPGMIAGALAALGQIIAAPFIAGWGIVSGWVETGLGWFAALPGRVGGALASVGSVLLAPFEAGWRLVSSGVTTAVGWFTGLPGRIGGAISGIAGTITSPFRSAFNGIASMWNRSIGRIGVTIPSWVPGLGGNSFSVPDIPLLAVGGTILRTGLAVVHEGEVVVPAAAGPLPPSLDLSAQRTRTLGSAGRPTGPSITLHQTVDARGATDPAAIRRAVNEANTELLRELTQLVHSGEGVIG
jgi:hypothetical protein